MVNALIDLCEVKSAEYAEEAQRLINISCLLLDSNEVGSIIQRAREWKDRPRFPRAIYGAVKAKAHKCGVANVPDEWNRPLRDYEQPMNLDARTHAAALNAGQRV